MLRAVNVEAENTPSRALGKARSSGQQLRMFNFWALLTLGHLILTSPFVPSSQVFLYGKDESNVEMDDWSLLLHTGT